MSLHLYPGKLLISTPGVRTINRIPDTPTCKMAEDHKPTPRSHHDDTDDTDDTVDTGALMLLNLRLRK